jgi:hypothetical protein
MRIVPSLIQCRWTRLSWLTARAVKGNTICSICPLYVHAPLASARPQLLLCPANLHTRPLCALSWQDQLQHGLLTSWVE